MITNLKYTSIYVAAHVVNVARIQYVSASNKLCALAQSKPEGSRRHSGQLPHQGDEGNLNILESDYSNGEAGSLGKKGNPSPMSNNFGTSSSKQNIGLLTLTGVMGSTSNILNKQSDFSSGAKEPNGMTPVGDNPMPPLTGRYMLSNVRAVRAENYRIRAGVKNDTAIQAAMPSESYYREENLSEIISSTGKSANTDISDMNKTCGISSPASTSTAPSKLTSLKPRSASTMDTRSREVIRDNAANSDVGPLDPGTDEVNDQVSWPSLGKNEHMANSNLHKLPQTERKGSGANSEKKKKRKPKFVPFNFTADVHTLSEKGKLPISGGKVGKSRSNRGHPKSANDCHAKLRQQLQNERQKDAKEVATILEEMTPKEMEYVVVAACFITPLQLGFSGDVCLIESYQKEMAERYEGCGLDVPHKLAKDISLRILGLYRDLPCTTAQQDRKIHEVFRCAELLMVPPPKNYEVYRRMFNISYIQERISEMKAEMDSITDDDLHLIHSYFYKIINVFNVESNRAVDIVANEITERSIMQTLYITFYNEWVNELNIDLPKKPEENGNHRPRHRGEDSTPFQRFLNWGGSLTGSYKTFTSLENSDVVPTVIAWIVYARNEFFKQLRNQRNLIPQIANSIRTSLESVGVCKLGADVEHVNIAKLFLISDSVFTTFNSHNALLYGFRGSDYFPRTAKDWLPVESNNLTVGIDAKDITFHLCLSIHYQRITGISSDKHCLSATYAEVFQYLKAFIREHHRLYRVHLEYGRVIDNPNHLNDSLLKVYQHTSKMEGLAYFGTDLAHLENCCKLPKRECPLKNLFANLRTITQWNLYHLHRLGGLQQSTLTTLLQYLCRQWGTPRKSQCLTYWLQFDSSPHGSFYTKIEPTLPEEKRKAVKAFIASRPLDEVHFAVYHQVAMTRMINLISYYMNKYKDDPAFASIKNTFVQEHHDIRRDLENLFTSNFFGKLDIDFLEFMESYDQLKNTTLELRFVYFRFLRSTILKMERFADARQSQLDSSTPTVQNLSNSQSQFRFLPVYDKYRHELTELWRKHDPEKYRTLTDVVFALQEKVAGIRPVTEYMEGMLAVISSSLKRQAVNKAQLN